MAAQEAEEIQSRLDKTQKSDNVEDAVTMSKDSTYVDSTNSTAREIEDTKIKSKPPASVLSPVQCGILFMFFLAFHLFFAVGAYLHFARAKSSLVMLCLVYAYILLRLVQWFFRAQLASVKAAIVAYFLSLDKRIFKYGKIILVVLFAVGLLIWLIIDAWSKKVRLRSLCAIFAYLLIAVLCSANPGRIKWRPVVGGVMMQLICGLILLRWNTGNLYLKAFSDEVVKFLDYANFGTRKVYGFIAAPPGICIPNSFVFLFTSMQILVYFAGVVAILYHYGIITAVLGKVAIFMQYTIGTTAVESLNAASCIFLGTTESMILIEPAVPSMTSSEIHAIMTSGMSCVAGALFNAYIGFGACPEHLLSSSVMSACVSLAISKILYPEIQVSKQKRLEDIDFSHKREPSVFIAIHKSAMHAAKIVMYIGANLVVFLALLRFLDKCLLYLGQRVGHEDVKFQTLLGYVFFPFAWMMGASDAEDWQKNNQETLRVAELMGIKTTVNEFVAYAALGDMIKAGQLGARASMVATYALCGFSNIATIGIMLGTLSPMMPGRSSTIAKLAPRALVGGIISCFLTAAVAGLLVSEAVTCKPAGAMGSCLNTTAVDGYFFARNLTAAQRNWTRPTMNRWRH